MTRPVCWWLASLSLLALPLFIMPPPASATSPVTVGLLYPRTGTSSEEGLMQIQGALMAVDEINAQGGVLGRPLVLVNADTASQAATVEMARPLIQRQVQLLIGDIPSQLAHGLRSHNLLYANTFPGLQGDDSLHRHRHFFRYAPTPTMQGAALGHYLASHYNHSPQFHISDDSAWGITIERAIRKSSNTLEQADNRASVPASPRYAQIKKAVEQAAASGAPLIVVNLTGRYALTTLQLIQQTRFATPPQVIVSNLSHTLLVQAGPSLMEGSIGASPWAWQASLGNPHAQGFTQRFARRYQSYPSASAALAWSFLHHWKETVETAGSLDAKQVAQTMAGLRQNLLKDEQAWRDFDQQNIQSIQILAVKPRQEVLQDNLRQDFFVTLRTIPGIGLAMDKQQWLTERARAGEPATLQNLYQPPTPAAVAAIPLAPALPPAAPSTATTPAQAPASTKTLASLPEPQPITAHSNAPVSQAPATLSAPAAPAINQYQPLLKQAPEYPERALERGIEGDCTVVYSVNTQGQVENPQIDGRCHPLLVRPSLKAAEAFVYQPRLVDGQAVVVDEVRNTFNYRIQR